MIYLDSAATTLEKPCTVRRAVLKALTECASPGRGGYCAAGKAADMMYRCREKAAELFDVPDPERIILTHNATHGLNIAIRTLVKPGANVVISGYEHNAVTRALHSIPNVKLSVAAAPLFAPNETIRSFEAAITEETDAVICNHVSNVFGYIQPVETISELCKKHGIPLIIDASQSAGILPISMEKLGAAFIAMPGHKGLYGPQGTGLLLCGADPDPILFGGTGSASINQQMPDYLPDRLEAGTPNVCGAAGLLTGMEFVKSKGIQNIGQYESSLCRRLSRILNRIPGVRVFEGPGQSGVLSVILDGIDCETVGERLAAAGIAVRAGLHCAPLAHRTAGTLESGTVRLSFSAFNSAWQLERTATVIRKIAESKRAQ